MRGGRSGICKTGIMLPSHIRNLPNGIKFSLAIIARPGPHVIPPGPWTIKRNKATPASSQFIRQSPKKEPTEQYISDIDRENARTSFSVRTKIRTSD